MDTVSVRWLKVIKMMVLPRIERMMHHPAGFGAPDVAFLHLVRARLLAGFVVEKDQRAEFFRLYRQWEMI